MERKLLFYRFGALNESEFERALQKMKLPFLTFSERMQDYHADSNFAMKFMKVLHKNMPQAVFSYEYFPLISMLCEMNHIPYLCWIYDCPLLTLQSKTILNSMNFIFCFDSIYTERLQKTGVVHCYHLPLAADEGRLPEIQKKWEKDSSFAQKYSCDISFLGNLYNENKNRLRKAELTEHSAGYLEGIIQAQLQVYGYNFIKDCLTEPLVKEITEACNLTLGSMYFQDKEQLAADAVGMEVSARERVQMLEKLSDCFDVQLYTGSVLPGELKKERLYLRGYADYEKEMPHIFYGSRINLNITSRTIESGIPLRVFDILSCGGFCLTNYQPEVAEYFKDGKELVMYTDYRDMLLKAEYYLSHEEERRQIALQGYEKICREHSLTAVLEQVLQTPFVE